MESIARMLTTMIQQLLDQGRELPIRVSVVARNGASMLGEYWQPPGGARLEFAQWAAHDVDGVLAFPINILFVDADGVGVHVTMQPEQAEPES
jgi:hypothetical protein